MSEFLGWVFGFLLVETRFDAFLVGCVFGALEIVVPCDLDVFLGILYTNLGMIERTELEDCNVMSFVPACQCPDQQAR